MPSYLLVTNPFSKRGLGEKKIAAVVKLLSAAGAHVDLVRTRGPGDATKAAAQAKPGLKAIIAAGGDGTIAEVVTGLAGKTIPIGIIPRGTANVLARQLDIPRRTKAAVRVILAGKALPLDVGLAGTRRFMLMASAGFDAQVVQAAHQNRGRRFGYASFILPMLKIFWKADFPEITVGMHGRKHLCRHVILANVPGYGGPFRPAPRAIYNDGEFDIVMYRRPGRWSMLRYGLCALCCSERPKNDIIRMRTDVVSLSSGGKVVYQLDGDAAGDLPCRFSIIRDGALFLVP